jgi:hypothetical protein
MAVEECLFDWYEGREIWGNLHLHPYFDKNYVTGERGNYHYIDAVDLIRMLLEDSDALKSELPKTLVLDEMKGQANARSFGSWINKHLTNFISQSRKRNFKVIYTDQILSAYDKWIRQMTDEITRCKPIIDANDIGWGTIDYPEPKWFERIQLKIDEDELMESRIASVKYRSRRNARMIYPLYQTGEMITPVELKYTDVPKGEES